MEFGGDSFGRQAFALVDRKHDRTPGAAKEVGDMGVLCRQALASVDEEDHSVAFGNRLPRLSRHRMHDAGLDLGFEASGVDHEIWPVCAEPAAEMPVARQSGKVGYQRIACLRQPVEEGGFADVGTADEDERGKHRCADWDSSAKRDAKRPSARAQRALALIRVPPADCQTAATPALAGCDSAAEPSVAIRPTRFPSLRSSRCR